MKISKILFFLAVLIQNSFSFTSQEIMPIKDIIPGMKGIGKTVFYGEKIEEFNFEVLEILPNTYPGQDIILVRLVGEREEKNGVVSGMSGSPCYIDGKLVGALALRYGQFMKEPIGGIRPISEMLAIADKEKNRKYEQITFNQNLSFDFIETSLCGVTDDFWGNYLGTLVSSDNSTINDLEKISSPLTFSGFDPQLLSQFSDFFKQLGFTPMTSGSSLAKSEKSSTKLEPGSAVSQVLVSGDVSIGATGTVTAVSDNQILAFGHEVFNIGPENVPMAGAKIVATLPSLMGSNKMAVPLDIIGSFRQDRMAGVLGDLSIKAPLIPVDITINHPDHTSNVIHVNMADEPTLNTQMPLYFYISFVQSIVSARTAGGRHSLQMDATINFSNGKKLTMNDYFSSNNRFGFFETFPDATAAGSLLASALGALQNTSFESPSVKKISVNLNSEKGEQVYGIDKIWQNKKQVKPGEPVTINIVLDDKLGGLKTIQKTIVIPHNIDAQSIVVYVSNGSTLTQLDVQTRRNKFVPQNFDHLVSILQNRRKNNKIYIQVKALDKGLMVDENELVNLPPSVMNVMTNRMSSGDSRLTTSRVLLEESITTDKIILGARKLSIDIIPPIKAVPQNEDTKNSNHTIYW